MSESSPYTNNVPPLDETTRVDGNLLPSHHSRTTPTDPMQFPLECDQQQQQPQQQQQQQQRSPHSTAYSLSQETARIGKLECAICLQNCIHPVLLPCSHIFCFLCVKGVANQSKRCAMCRQEIPPDFLDNPELVPTANCDLEVVFEDGYQWFYEGRNGWWQYDERTSLELEAAYKRGEQKCEVLIAGFLYIVDFDKMVQARRTDPSRRRRIKRDLANIPKKGVAGIRIHSTLPEDPLLPTTPPSVSDDSPIENIPADGASLPDESNWSSCIPILDAPSVPANSSSPPIASSPSSSWPPTSKDALSATMAITGRSQSPKSVPATPTNTPRSPDHSPTDGGICGPSSPATVSSQIVDDALAEVIHNLRLCDEQATAEGTASHDDIRVMSPGARTRWTEELYGSDDEHHV